MVVSVAVASSIVIFPITCYAWLNALGIGPMDWVVGGGGIGCWWGRNTTTVVLLNKHVAKMLLKYFLFIHID